MSRFLESPGNLFPSLRKTIARCDRRLWLAVAYWGDGAEEKLDLRNVPRSFRVVCDLRSGGCNPDVIRSLWRKNKTAVRYLDGLHAKVYLGDDSCVVGSANVSSSGLNWEGNEAGALIEAAVHITDTAVVTSIENWFSGIWNQSREIDDEVLKAAHRRWRERRKSRLVSEAAASPAELFKDRPVYVSWSENEENSRAAEEAFSSVAKERGLNKAKWDYYEDAKISWYVPDSYMVQVDWTHLNYNHGVDRSFWQVPKPLVAKRLPGKKGYVVLLGKCAKIEIDNRKVGLNDSLRELIWDAIKALMNARSIKRSGVRPLYEILASYAALRREPSARC